MAQLAECCPGQQEVHDLIPGQCHMPGLWAPCLLGTCGRQKKHLRENEWKRQKITLMLRWCTVLVSSLRIPTVYQGDFPGAAVGGGLVCLWCTSSVGY